MTRAARRAPVWIGLAALTFTAGIACGGKVLPEEEDGGGLATDQSADGSSISENRTGSGGALDAAAQGQGPGSSSSSGAVSSSSGAVASSSGAVASSSSGGSSSGDISLGCQGGDCSGGEVCCASVNFTSGLSVSSACAQAPCPSSDYQFCTSNTECPTGDTCQNNPLGEGPKICSSGSTGG